MQDSILPLIVDGGYGPWPAGTCHLLSIKSKFFAVFTKHQLQNSPGRPALPCSDGSAKALCDIRCINLNEGVIKEWGDVLVAEVDTFWDVCTPFSVNLRREFTPPNAGCIGVAYGYALKAENRDWYENAHDTDWNENMPLRELQPIEVVGKIFPDWAGISTLVVPPASNGSILLEGEYEGMSGGPVFSVRDHSDPLSYEGVIITGGADRLRLISAGIVYQILGTLT